MALYLTNELAFDLPDGAVDRTTHELDAPLPGGHFLGLLVDRAPLPEETSFADAVREHTAGERRRLTFYRVIEAREGNAAGSPAIEVAYTWAHRGLPFYGRELHVARGDDRLTFSTTAPLDQRKVCDAYFDRLIATLELSPPGPRARSTEAV
jgi:hypothetical protein